MKELLNALREFMLQNMGDVENISDLDGLENIFVVEMKNGKKYALSLNELD